jgi:DNA repair protein RadC
MIPEITISVKYSKKVAKKDRVQLKSSYDTAEVLRNIFNQDTFGWREEMILLCLNRANEVCGYYKISSGGVAGTICDPKVVFTTALNCTASNIILAHNHPSGNVQPSSADFDITKKIVAGGKLLDIGVLDHIIITEESYYSFADECQL